MLSAGDEELDGAVAALLGLHSSTRPAQEKQHSIDPQPNKDVPMVQPTAHSSDPTKNNVTWNKRGHSVFAPSRSARERARQGPPVEYVTRLPPPYPFYSAHGVSSPYYDNSQQQQQQQQQHQQRFVISDRVQIQRHLGGPEGWVNQPQPVGHHHHHRCAQHLRPNAPQTATAAFGSAPMSTWTPRTQKPAASIPPPQQASFRQQQQQQQQQKQQQKQSPQIPQPSAGQMGLSTTKPHFPQQKKLSDCAGERPQQQQQQQKGVVKVCGQHQHAKTLLVHEKDERPSRPRPRQYQQEQQIQQDQQRQLEQEQKKSKINNLWSLIPGTLEMDRSQRGGGGGERGNENFHQPRLMGGTDFSDGGGGGPARGTHHYYDPPTNATSVANAAHASRQTSMNGISRGGHNPSCGSGWFAPDVHPPLSDSARRHRAHALARLRARRLALAAAAEAVALAGPPLRTLKRQSSDATTVEAESSEGENDSVIMGGGGISVINSTINTTVLEGPDRERCRSSFRVDSNYNNSSDEGGRRGGGGGGGSGIRDDGIMRNSGMSAMENNSRAAVGANREGGLMAPFSSRDGGAGARSPRKVTGTAEPSRAYEDENVTSKGNGSSSKPSPKVGDLFELMRSVSANAAAAALAAENGGAFGRANGEAVETREIGRPVKYKYRQEAARSRKRTRGRFVSEKAPAFVSITELMALRRAERERQRQQKDDTAAVSVGAG